jgi:glycoprotein endo-alpha-1,2-mannosidase
MCSITSYNEWGEGTQIEPAKAINPQDEYPKEYLDYGDGGPHKYIKMTADFVKQYRNRIPNREKREL